MPRRVISRCGSVLLVAGLLATWHLLDEGSAWGRSVGHLAATGARVNGAATVVFGVAQPEAPIENRLSAGTTGFLRSVRKKVRQFFRVIRAAGRRWMDWTGGAILFTVLAALAPIVDREVFATWRDRGLQAFGRSISLAFAVYVRLLMDGRAPLVGKALIGFAIVYGVSPTDLLNDRAVPSGLIDDVLLVTLASRSFMRTCPDALVEAHAAGVARAREESMRRRGKQG